MKRLFIAHSRHVALAAVTAGFAASASSALGAILPPPAAPPGLMTASVLAPMVQGSLARQALQQAAQAGPAPRQSYQTQVAGFAAPGTLPSSDAMQLGGDVASALSAGSYIQFPAQDIPSGLWNGQGDMPGSFQRPWTFAPTSFDPSFRTPYWSEAGGFTDHASAPWNRGLAAQFGPEIWAASTKYLGPFAYEPLAPVFMDPSAPASSGKAM